MSDLVDGAVLTQALLQPVAVRDPDALRRAMEPIGAELATLARSRLGGSLRLTDHDVRLSLAGRVNDRTSTPFAWSARTARRGLGLAAIRSLVAGEVRSPSEGVRAAIAQSTRWVRQDGRPTSTMDRWLAGLSAAGRAAVGAEAVTWATRLWCALDWSAFEAPPVIGRDHWWDSPHSSLLALRSRAEVRTGAAHLVVLGGARRSNVRSELSVVALVEGLLSRRPEGGVRIVGWWPEAGHHVALELDQTVLELGVATVARALAGGEKASAA